jgi:hypothetical protein
MDSIHILCLVFLGVSLLLFCLWHTAQGEKVHWRGEYYRVSEKYQKRTAELTTLRGQLAKLAKPPEGE